MNRVVLTTLTLSIMMASTALAAEGSSYSVKCDATDPADAYQQILKADLSGAEGTISEPPSSFNADHTATITPAEGDPYTINVTVVAPELKAKEIPAIKATSIHNASATSLLEYVNQYRTLDIVNTAYTEALGTAPAHELSKYTQLPTYHKEGGTYTLRPTYDGKEYAQTLVVEATSMPTPNIRFTDDKKISCTPEAVMYSTDKSKWMTISSGATLPSNLVGQTVYFKSSATAYAAESSVVSLRVPYDQDAPTIRPVLSSTSFSVTLENAGDYNRDCEFSIDGKSYSSKTSWTGLKAGTAYTVYVRYEGDSSYFPSKAITGSISTKAAQKNEITCTKVVSDTGVHLNAVGTTAVNVSNNTLSASYTSTQVRELERALSTSDTSRKIITVLSIAMEAEEGDTRAYNKVKFTTPKLPGTAQLRLTTPYFTVITSDDSTSVEVEKLGTATPTYKVTTKGNGSIEIKYPWEFPERGYLDTLNITYKDSQNKTAKLKYQAGTDCVYFTLPSDGQFTVESKAHTGQSVPFKDVMEHWAYPYIAYAYDNGLVKGITATEFSPDSNVTRAQAVVLLARLSGAQECYSCGCTTPYMDVKSDSWYCWAVDYLCDKGVLSVPSDKLFKPNESISREEMATLTSRAFPYNGTIWSPLNCSDRSAISAAALPYVDALYNQRVFIGDNKNNFNPKNTLTRAEFVAVLYRLSEA